MPRTVHMRIVPPLPLILHMRRRNRDPARLLLGRIVNTLIGPILPAKSARGYQRQRRGQRRLPMIHMTNRPYIYMRLGSLKFPLGHGYTSFYLVFLAYALCLMTASAMR